MLPRRSAGVSFSAGVAALLLASVALPAAAQPDDDPLRFLKPSLNDEGLPVDPGAPAAPPADPAANTDVRAPEPGAASPPASETIVDPPPPAMPPGAAEPDRPENANAAGDGAASAPPEGSGPSAEAPRPVRFGVIAGRDLAATMSRMEPVADDLGRILGRSVELLPMSSYEAMIDAQVQQRIDGGFYSASAYMLAESQCRCLEPIAAPTAHDGTIGFHAVILALPGSSVGSAADLEGKVVAAGAPDSVGNRRMQIAGLLAQGIDPGRIRAVRDVESGAAAVRMMLAGGADAAFAWSSLQGEQQAGYSRGTLADLVAAGEIEMGDVAIVWRSPLVPHGPVAVLKTLPDSDKERIETYLLGLATDNPAAYDALNPFYSGGYEAVEPTDYEAANILISDAIDDVELPSAAPGSASAEPLGTATDGERDRR